MIIELHDIDCDDDIAISYEGPMTLVVQGVIFDNSIVIACVQDNDGSCLCATRLYRDGNNYRLGKATYYTDNPEAEQRASNALDALWDAADVDDIAYAYDQVFKTEKDAENLNSDEDARTITVNITQQVLVGNLRDSADTTNRCD